MKNSHILSSLAIKWCNFHSIPVGRFYQEFKSFLSNLSSGVKDADLLFRMYKFQKNAKKEELLNSLSVTVSGSDAATFFIANLAILSLRHSNDFSLLYEVFIIFKKKIDAKDVLIRFANDVEREKMDRLSAKILDHYSGAASVSMSVDNKLIEGWVLYNNFFKTDASLFGKMERLLDSLSF